MRRERRTERYGDGNRRFPFGPSSLRTHEKAMYSVIKNAVIILCSPENVFSCDYSKSIRTRTAW
jgi:hypothetical protein